MEVKCLEVRDAGTFCPVICIRPVAENDKQLWLLRRDGYTGGDGEQCIIMIAPQCREVQYDPYSWRGGARTFPTAHKYITEHWSELSDGHVVDVEWILKERIAPKTSERIHGPLL